ncbi:MAG: isoaspartyl peptidase/L-asparaginase [Fimbriimonadaceae bacterium]|nr:MAG: isoaspartyl peptidase/L-asparaginase [Fimbriimonadaceae bacterium]
MRTIVSTWKRPGEVAIKAALIKSNAGGSMLDAIEAGLTAAEADPTLVAIGKGSLPNTDGELELDASCMLGKDLSAGAVCALRGILPAITAARYVMERTNHVMLAGDQARRFAISQGLTPQNLVTEEIARRFEMFLVNPDQARQYVHAVEDEPPHDTVTMLARENNDFVACSSTSGMPYKMPGRVGDSPIVGAGIYADNEAGCAGATGMGEELWKACASFRAVEFMRNGASAMDACNEVAQIMRKRQPKSLEIPCVVLALDKQGGFGAATTSGTFELWVAEGDSLQRHDFVPQS